MKLVLKLYLSTAEETEAASAAMLKKCNDTFKYDKITSRWRQMSILMSKSFVN